MIEPLKIVSFIAFLLVTFHATNSTNLSDDLTDVLINHVNNIPGGTWRAARNERFKNLDDFRKLLGALEEPEEGNIQRLPRVHQADNDEPLPKNFDSRNKWKKCPSISHIWDQSSCGSCWAFSAVSTMTDRVCIHSGETTTDVWLSVTDMLSCCRDCGHGCEGGSIIRGWIFWKTFGVVTGGEYNKTETCLPYPFPPCNHHGGRSKYDDCPRELYETPRCTRTCLNGKNYYSDKIRGQKVYRVPNSAKEIQREIFKNGPVSARFDVHADFRYYKEGVYQHVAGERIGGHAIRVIGWGETEEKVPYWLIANSWNDEWAEKGTFRMIRGKNDCGIEASVYGGIPIL